MNTNTYGNANFKHKTNFGSIVVFSDEEKGLTNQEQIPKSNNQYIHIYQNPETNKWIAKLNDRLTGEYGDFIIYTKDLLPVSNLDANQLTFFLTPDQEPQFGDTIMDYYLIDGKLYLQANATITLEEVVITAKKSDKEIAPQQEEQLDAFVTVFVSSDGAKLERAYQQINSIQDRELAIFAEKDDNTNFFGSVFRVNSGSKISDNSIYPKLELASTLRDYTNDPSFSLKALSDLISQYFKDKDSKSIFLWLPRLASSFVKLAADFTLEPLGEAMYFIADEIDKELRLDDKRWQATIDGKPNTKYKPLLPGYELLADDNIASKWTNKINNKFIEPLAKPIKKLIRKLNNNKLIKRFIGNKLDGLLKFIEELPNYLESVIQSIFKFLKQAFEFYNALLVGIINSLVDLLKSVFEILGLICKGLYALIAVGDKAIKNPGSFAGLILEAFENLISVVVSAFALDNLKAFFNFQLYIITAAGKLGVVVAQKAIQFLKGETTENEAPEEDTILPFDAIGYYTGYIIGFIAQEVAIFMATAGVGTVAKGIQGAVKSYVALGKAIGNAAKATAKGVQRGISVSVEAFLKGLRALKNFVKQIPKHLENLKLWIDELLDSLTKSKLFQKFKAVLQLLEDLGVVIAQKLDPSTGKVLVQGADGTVYAIKQGDKTIFEGTKTAIEGFLNKIEDISKSGGNATKKTQKYLDELADKVQKYSRKASKLDVEILAKIRSKYRPRSTRNVAYSKGKIGGDKIDLEIVSGGKSTTPWQQKGNFEPPKPKDYHFKNGPESFKINDTEQNIFEYLYRQYKHSKEIKGVVEVVSDLRYCDNCWSIANQFQKEFKNIEIIRVFVRESLK